MVILSIYILCLAFCIWLLIRNHKTYKFMTGVSRMCYDAISRALDKGILDVDEYYEVWNKLSYHKVLFSFKPLKLEYWFTEEEIELLNRYK